MAMAITMKQLHGIYSHHWGGSVTNDDNDGWLLDSLARQEPIAVNWGGRQTKLDAFRAVRRLRDKAKLRGLDPTSISVGYSPISMGYAPVIDIDRIFPVPPPAAEAAG